MLLGASCSNFIAIFLENGEANILLVLGPSRNSHRPKFPSREIYKLMYNQIFWEL
jgi:hypothetical protein